MKIQEIKNTLGPHQRETLVLRKGDVGGTVHFTVPDLTGITSADFRLIKPDGTFVVKSGAIVQNTVIVQITEQMCTVYGSGIYNLELKASGVSVYTAIGRCLIDKNIDLNDYAASVAEVNGLVFPDDFLTSADLSDYVTETELETAISNFHTLINFSTSEQNTGLKWIDGKPIYQRTFNPNITLTTTGQSVMAMTDIDTIVEVKPLLVKGGNQCQSPYSPSDAFVTWQATSGNLLFYITGQHYNDAVLKYVTVLYTKTTDTTNN